MKPIRVIIVVLVIVMLIGAVLYFMGGDILQMGGVKSLQALRSQVKAALPADYPADKLMNEFDAVLNRAKDEKINTAKLKNLLFETPAKLKDGALDSVEVDSLIQQLQKIVEVKQK